MAGIDGNTINAAITSGLTNDALRAAYGSKYSYYAWNWLYAAAKTNDEVIASILRGVPDTDVPISVSEYYRVCSILGVSDTRSKKVASKIGIATAGYLRGSLADVLTEIRAQRTTLHAELQEQNKKVTDLISTLRNGAREIQYFIAQKILLAASYHSSRAHKLSEAKGAPPYIARNKRALAARDKDQMDRAMRAALNYKFINVREIEQLQEHIENYSNEDFDEIIRRALDWVGQHRQLIHE